MANTTLLRYVSIAERLGDKVTVTLPNGDVLEGLVLSLANIPGLETVTIGYGGLASQLRQRDEDFCRDEGFCVDRLCERCGERKSTALRDGRAVCDDCFSSTEKT
jgi:hypothetical protein